MLIFALKNSFLFNFPIKKIVEFLRKLQEDSKAKEVYRKAWGNREGVHKEAACKGAAYKDTAGREAARQASFYDVPGVLFPSGLLVVPAECFSLHVQRPSVVFPLVENKIMWF